MTTNPFAAILLTGVFLSILSLPKGEQLSVENDSPELFVEWISENAVAVEAIEPGSGLAELEPLKTIPGIGPVLAQELTDLGYRRVSQLRGVDPEAIYQDL